MGMLLAFFVFTYILFCKAIYNLVKKKTNNKKIQIAIIIIAILIPTYDIIITNVLGLYYCCTIEKTFINETVEYPESVYFEDNIRGGYSEDDIRIMLINYLDGIHLKKIAFNTSNNEVLVYELDNHSENYLSYVKNHNEYYREKEKELKLKKELNFNLEKNKIVALSQEHHTYLKKIEQINKKAKEYKKIRDEEWEILLKKTILPRQHEKNIRYSVILNKLSLNDFTSMFLYSYETLVKRDNFTIARDVSFSRLFYNIAPDLVGGRYLAQRMCGYEGILYRDVFKTYSRTHDLYPDRVEDLSEFLYNIRKNRTGEKNDNK